MEIWNSVDKAHPGTVGTKMAVGVCNLHHPTHCTIHVIRPFRKLQFVRNVSPISPLIYFQFR